jgi:ribosomal protein S18 acetylase RimI-like enzyme
MAKTPPLIRPYAPDRHRDQLRVCIVALQDFERGLEGTLPRGEEMADAQLEFLMERCSTNAGQIFVAEIDDAVVGFVGVLTRVPPETPDEDVRPYAYVSDPLVLAPYRHRGLGRALLEHAVAFARSAGATSVRIGVLANNAAARKLYESLGFTDRNVQLVKRLE